MRQEHVKEDLLRTNSESRSPIKKTFAEAKQNLFEYTNTQSYDSNDSFSYCDKPTNYIDYGEQTYDEEEENVYDQELKQSIEEIKSTTHAVRSNENFINDSPPEYYQQRRRQSKDLIENEIIISPNDREIMRRKPETMRSVSEDTGTRVAKPVTRRSLSHPENNSVYFNSNYVEFKKK